MMEDVTRKVQALMAKAEGTDNQHESAAFYAKAQELMLRYSLDAATLREARAKRGDKASPILVDFEYAPSEMAVAGKRILLAGLARANRVRMLDYGNRPYSNMGRPGNTGPRTAWCALVGFEADVEFVRMLYVSLVAQALRLANLDYQQHSWEGKPSFLTAFVAGFAATVRERLAEQKREAPLSESMSALVVRVEQQVDDHVADLFPMLRQGRSFSTNSSSGYVAGRRAGHQADIHPKLSSSARQLGQG
jgi:hypothetical protein